MRIPSARRNPHTGQVCTLIDAKEKGGMYNVEYTLAKTGEFDRHLLQVVAIGTSGYYNRLYTVTAQVGTHPFHSPLPINRHSRIG
jgi:hypothetical protein